MEDIKDLIITPQIIIIKLVDFKTRDCPPKTWLIGFKTCSTSSASVELKRLPIIDVERASTCCQMKQD